MITNLDTGRFTNNTKQMKTEQEILDLLKSNTKPYGLMIQEDWWCDQANVIFEDARINNKLLYFNGHDFIERKDVKMVSSQLTYIIHNSYKLVSVENTITDLYEFIKIENINGFLVYNVDSSDKDDNRILTTAINKSNFIGILYTKEIPKNLNDLKMNIHRTIGVYTENVHLDEPLTRTIPEWTVFKK